MTHHGFVRVAAAVPPLRVADCAYNAERTPRPDGPRRGAGRRGPRLPRAGPHRLHLRRPVPPARPAARRPAPPWTTWSGEAARSSRASPSSACRWPWTTSSSTAPPCFSSGRVLGVVPKSFLPNYKEFYEARWFAPAATARSRARSPRRRRRARSAPTCSSTPPTSTGWSSASRSARTCGCRSRPARCQALAGATVLRQPVGQQRGHRQGRLPPAARRQPVGPLHRRLRLRLVRRRRIDHRRRLRRPLPDRRERHAAGRVAALPARRAPARRRRRPRPPARRPACGPTASATPSRPGDRTASFRRVAVRRWTGAADRAAAARRRRAPVRAARPGAARASAARRSSTPRSPGWPSGWSTSASRRCAIGVSGGLDSTLALLVACKTLRPARRAARRSPGASPCPASAPPARTHDQRPGPDAAPRRHGRARSTSAPLCLEEMRALGHAPFGIDLDGLDVETLDGEAAAAAGRTAAATWSSRTCRPACGPAC